MTKCICVWYWFIFLPYVSPFLKKESGRAISIDVSTKHHVIKAERAQTKSGKGFLRYKDILTCYETFIVVICINPSASMRLFTFDTKWRVLTEHVSGSHVFSFRPSKVNSYKTSLHNLN